MSTISSVDPIEQLLKLRARFEEMTQFTALRVSFSHSEDGPFDFAIKAYNPSIEDRFHLLVIKAGRCLKKLPDALHVYPVIAKEVKPADAWLRLLYELKPGLRYFEGDSLPGRPAGNRRSGIFFGPATRSVIAIDRLALLVTEREKNEGDKQKPGGGGRKKLGDSNDPELVARHKVYQLVRAEKERHPRWGKQTLLAYFKTDQDFKNQVTGAGLTFGLPMFQNALKWIRDNPATDTAQELNSGT